jgi:OFA family oxalate/formate antiporter-like MFS transporter
MQLSVSRTKYAVAPILMQVLLGMLYSWSVFRVPLAKAYGWSNVQTNAPFSYSILALVAGTLLGGLWQDRVGPRLVASVGGVLICLGWLLSALFGHTGVTVHLFGVNSGISIGPATVLILTYGCIVGLGTGFGYVAPIATLVKWFPDKRGMMVGLAVMGIGVSPLIFAPFIEFLIGKDPARYASTIPSTFMVIAFICLIGVVGAAQFCKAPPAGWKPAGWEPSTRSAASGEQRGPGAMLATWQFYVLWVVYLLGASVGLTAISQVAPLLAVTIPKADLLISVAAWVGVVAVFNGVGRLAWGSVSDKLGRVRTMLVMGLCAAIACGAVVRGATNVWQLVAGLSLGVFAFGGYLALMPSVTADYYGPKHVGANYGLVFTAFGVSGFFVPPYFAGIVDKAKAAGNIAAGYNQVYLILAGMALVAAVLVLALRPPREPAAI